MQRPLETSARRSDLPQEPVHIGMVLMGHANLDICWIMGTSWRFIAYRGGGARIPAEAAALGDSRHHVVRLRSPHFRSPYDLLEDGFQEGGIMPIIGGAIGGSVAYAAADWLVSKSGGHHRKQSGNEQQHASEGGGLAIAIGSLLDGIPESIVLGLGLLAGHGVSLAMLAAIFLSNFPEGLSSAIGMKAAGRSKTYIFGLWITVVVASGAASLIGAAAFGGAPSQVVAGVNAVAAGALLTMVVNTMIPEAVEGEQNLTGILVVFGLLVAFSLSNFAGG